MTIWRKERIVMLKNSNFWKAAIVRMLKTMAQTALSMLTVGQAVLDVDWLNVLSVSAVAGIISLLTSIATGLPEVETDAPTSEE